MHRSCLERQPGWGHGQGTWWSEGGRLGQMLPETKIMGGTEKATAVLTRVWALGQEGADGS